MSADGGHFVAQSHTPCNRCVRFATTVASGHATLATKRTLLLTWAGLPPAGSRPVCLAPSLNHLVGAAGYGGYVFAPPGRRTVKAEPLPGSLVTVTSPPIMRASLRVIAGPRPGPQNRARAWRRAA